MSKNEVLVVFGSKPKHYQEMDETVFRKMNKSQFMGFCFGNVLKYNYRKKDEEADSIKKLNYFVTYCVCAGAILRYNPDDTIILDIRGAMRKSTIYDMYYSCVLQEEKVLLYDKRD